MILHLDPKICGHQCRKPFAPSKLTSTVNSSRQCGRLQALPATCAKQQAAQPVHSRHVKAVELRRGDLTWRQPPWQFDNITTADALQLGSLKEIDSSVSTQANGCISCSFKAATDCIVQHRKLNRHMSWCITMCPQLELDIL